MQSLPQKSMKMYIFSPSAKIFWPFLFIFKREGQNSEGRATPKFKGGGGQSLFFPKITQKSCKGINSCTFSLKINEDVLFRV